jgi:hypothetical protein
VVAVAAGAVVAVGASGLHAGSSMPIIRVRITAPTRCVERNLIR